MFTVHMDMHEECVSRSLKVNEWMREHSDTKHTHTDTDKVIMYRDTRL